MDENVLYFGVYNSVLGVMLRREVGDFKYDVVSKQNKVNGRLRRLDYDVLVMEDLSERKVEILRKANEKGIGSIVLVGEGLSEAFKKEAMELGAKVITVPIGADKWKEIIPEFSSSIENFINRKYAQKN
ncbi:MAG: hypothetical protein AABW51_01580 [Nanoarchaeota archaeon]